MVTFGWPRSRAGCAWVVRATVVGLVRASIGIGSSIGLVAGGGSWRGGKRREERCTGKGEEEEREKKFLIFEL